MQQTQVAVRRLPHAEGLELPSYATSGAAGMDLCAAVAVPVTLKVGERALVPTGLAIALPEGFEVQIRSRSGLSSKNGVVVLNSPATIDSDYRGELQIILANFGSEPFTISRGMRVAQMVVARHEQVSWTQVETLPETDRGTGGFGSTGVG